MIQIPYTLRTLAGEEETRLGERLFRAGRVRIAEKSAKLLRCQVVEEGRYEVTISADAANAASHRCTCLTSQENGACRHIIAAMMACQDAGAMDEMIRRRAVASGPKLMAAMDRTLPEEGTLRMSVRLIVEPIREGENDPSGQPCRLKLVLLIGEERLYVVKSIPQMLEAIDAGTTIEYGKGFTFQPEWMRFGPTENRILSILRAMCLAQKEGGVALRGAEQRELLLPAPYAEAILHELRALPFSIKDGDNTHSVKRVIQSRIPLHFRVSSDLRGLSVVGRFPKEFRPLTASCSYALVGDKVVHVEEAQRNILRVLYNEQLAVGSQCQFDYPLREAARVIGELVPFLQMTAVVEIAEELQRQLIRLPLTARVYLDRAGNGKDVVARVTFRYGEREIDPFDELPLPETISRTEKLLLRDAAAERQVLDALGASGFTVSKGHVYLAGQDAIFDFVSEGVAKLQSVSEVYLSNEFKRLAPRKPKFRGRMRMNGTALEFKFEEDGEPAQEIYAIMEAIARRRRYFRLKDGSFLDLSAMEEWQPLADSIYEVATVEGIDFMTGGEDIVQMQAYRTCYMENLLAGLNVPVEVEDNVHETVRALTQPSDEEIKLPEGLTLRPYQQRGVQWMHTLDKLHLGGVLADDMGLGKTVQVIALLLSARDPERKIGAIQPSIVVAPTTLTYNWLSELERFAPDLSVMVMAGTAAQRASQIRHVKEVGDVDVLITSYPLIRQDIQLFSDIDFRFAILDEAQHIKNAGSKGAIAVRQLRAQTRFALTGTPLENGVGELWSIFNFVLPGYLLSYSAFMRRYQDGSDAEDLRSRISPFLMRRLKKDVLTELPDKIETVMTAQMSPEQSKVYQATMLRLRDRVDAIVKEKGFDKGRTEVLAAITQLREICCHPALVLDDYTGASGKLDMLLEILPEAIAKGRRVLLFSAFTSMLKILRRELENSGYGCMYLDGDTPAPRRVEMCEQFNSGAEGTQIFLISLKAGGTGLNLTGADMVIHYDPWWNPAAEEQATDRAYRIGQTRKVEVIRLVTHGSIEEQVVALGQRKRALFDQLIKPGESQVAGLSPQEIMSLFR
ncbi:MAG: SNF2 helicase associated domain-containing protein [Clostridia bacterium]|nr:SNF2 helicase associated domain-containing protein [Clostridia bacterium]